MAIRHVDDGDDTVARTQVAARFQGEESGEAILSRSARRVRDELRKRSEPASTYALRKVLSMNSNVCQKALDELGGSGIVVHRDGKWKLSASDFFEALEGGST